MASLIEASIARRPRKEPAATIDIKSIAQGSCIVFLETARLAISTMFMVLGLPLFVFLFLVGWDLGLFFTQLGNLAAHYLSAEPGQRLLFSADLKITFILLSSGLLLVRMPRFFAILDQAFPDNNERGPSQ
ncbi:hypothetical protein AB1K62_11585 [Parasphingorhabdus sp. JC815]|uniref:hypothetical protein n=1 Tax=Parasphingorhabdus sp. JC815 TaxID=3232140 RepID=UPI003459A0C6